MREKCFVASTYESQDSPALVSLKATETEIILISIKTENSKQIDDIGHDS